MQRRVADIEYEQMLHSRYTIAQHRPANGLERSAYLLLSRIHAEGPKSIGELSEFFRLDTSTVQRQTSAAMRAGLIERIPDPHGGIARKFALTKTGLASLTEVRERSVRALDDILSDWSDEDVATFADLLHRLNQDIEQYSAATREARRRTAAS
ncbi:MarR family winged helix-turn-helix transcriptional regulator [Agromyces sp. Marseille-Q5079]|uniref:MarR family winged helix-turn-helix transcriptional regulator n=1 Tax=Agromyces sp. Marseille-Q5079 TaxID=3439059 RepID=UPI003D9C8AA2